MTVLTDVGRQYLDDHRFGRSVGPIDTIAVGVGTGPEDFANETLSDEVYRSSSENSNVTFPSVPNEPAATYARIELQGGLEVPSGTDITEIGVIASGTDTLVFRDVRSAVTIEAGDRRALQIRLDTERL